MDVLIEFVFEEFALINPKWDQGNGKNQPG